MKRVVAAVRTGHDPVGKLPEAAFHRQLDEQVVCPKCDATYNLLVDFDWSVSRFFEAESRQLIAMLRKCIMRGHGFGHQVLHFETAGVVVTAFGEPTEERAAATRAQLPTGERTPAPASPRRTFDFQGNRRKLVM